MPPRVTLAVAGGLAMGAVAGCWGQAGSDRRREHVSVARRRDSIWIGLFLLRCLRASMGVMLTVEDSDCQALTVAVGGGPSC